ncbi:NADH dehydrogenase [Rhodococcus wratislaviensis]|uniref:NADH dehydrogenase n=1 Tax=Rhodococcus wratislaviensis TaxID=44752 RepID=A0A402C2S0_RHOWR|nr:FAD-dependent oxidoreductase [Rhodococcus wratislaviensis]GCE37935.1 NADH dehydrogenase [Rhodococcus wratislaviensis]
MTSPTAPAASPRQRVVVIGSGFGGLFATKALRRADADVTIVDRTTHLRRTELIESAARQARRLRDRAHRPGKAVPTARPERSTSLLARQRHRVRVHLDQDQPPHEEANRIRSLPRQGPTFSARLAHWSRWSVLSCSTARSSPALQWNSPDSMLRRRFAAAVNNDHLGRFGKASS